MDGPPLPPPPPPPPGVSKFAIERPGDESDDNRFQKRCLDRQIEVVLTPLHECASGMLERVFALLSERWPKSDRSTSQIGRSCDSFPVSLVLFDRECESEPLGHVLLSRCVEDELGLLAESVLVTHRLRGGGIGRKLMELMHEYARQRGFNTVYLSTRDKRDFYAHLGYVVCAPVTIASQITQERSSAMIKLKDVFGGASAGPKFVWMKFDLFVPIRNR